MVGLRGGGKAKVVGEVVDGTLRLRFGSVKLAGEFPSSLSHVLVSTASPRS